MTAFLALAFYQQSPKPAAAVSTIRQYHVGEKDNYRLNIYIENSGSVRADLTEEVAKVYTSGEADIAEKVTNIESTGDLKFTEIQNRTFKLTTFGVISQNPPPDPVSWVSISMILPNAEGLSAKQYITFDRSLPMLGDVQVRGSVNITEQSGPIAAMTITGTIANAFGKDAVPSDFTGSLLWDSSASRYNKCSYVVRGRKGGTQANKITITLERIIPNATKTGR